MKWRNADTDKPELDNYDDPIQYVVIFKGEDPRRGRVDIALMTAEEIKKEEYSERWYWLDESPDDKDKEIERLRGLIASMLYRVWKGLESSLSYDEFVTDFKEKHNL